MTQLITRDIEYTAPDGTKLKGFFVAPPSTQPLAGILLGPEWWGCNDFLICRAKQLAEQGYAAFAMDMYGAQKATEDAEQAKQWMMETFEKPKTVVERAQVALDTLAEQPEVDPKQLAAIGFCYGGKVVLELARTNAPLHVTASFHGNLTTNNPAQKGKFHGDVLICHGEDDSMVSLDDVKTIDQELTHAEVPHQILILEHAKHGFTNPLADERGQRNGVDLAYNPEATQKSFDALHALLKKKFDV